MAHPTLEKTQPESYSLEQSLEFYRKLRVIRNSEEKIRKEYFNDEMKTPVHLGIGGEAISVGVCSAVPTGTKYFGTYRNHAMYLAVTDDIDGFFAEMYGKATGPGKGKAGSMHMSLPEKGIVATSAVVATTIPVAVGAAMANAHKGNDDLVVVFFGDGAVEEGVFWESVNFACHKKLRILFVCEDNGLAIHTAVQARQGFKSIPEVVSGFKCHVESGNGTSVPDVMQHTTSLLGKMKKDSKPGFLHLDYFRFLEHVGPLEDFKFGYRPKPSDNELKEKDPIQNYEHHLLNKGVSEKQLSAIQDEVNSRIEAAVKKAQEAPFPDPSELYSDVMI